MPEERPPSLDLKPSYFFLDDPRTLLENILTLRSRFVMVFGELTGDVFADLERSRAALELIESIVYVLSCRFFGTGLVWSDV
jgi:hypothetical protein